MMGAFSDFLKRGYRHFGGGEGAIPLSEGLEAFCLGGSAFLGLRISLLLRRWLLAMCFSNSWCWKELRPGRSSICPGLRHWGRTY